MRNRSVFLRVFCGNDSSQHIQIIMTYPLSTLSRRVSGDSAQALRHNKNGVQTAFKRQANSQTTLLTACTTHYFNFGAGALPASGYQTAHADAHSLAINPTRAFCSNHVPAPSQIKSWRQITTPALNLIFLTGWRGLFIAS